MSRAIDDARVVTKAGKWTVDASASTAIFAVRNHGKTVEGTVPVRSGSVTFGPDGQLESVCGEVDLSAIDTGHKRRDKDLRKPGLLDLDAHPYAIFSADEVSATADGWTVAGTFSARGRETRVEFHADRDRTSLGMVLVAEATFDRRSLGIRAPSFMIGKVVTMRLRAPLTRD
ncbi:YceI family protein [Aldersonia kunmingensis]|uniref:YceI family protein n=1 Tax=Aldersonia kunmingensis TaxID=408066 RepID=UPI00082D3688|nr:YceI family protein [Aldersonia kunmingensis]